MFLECFFHDPFDATSWSLDVDFLCVSFLVSARQEVEAIRGYRHLTPRALPIKNHRLEELAEEMLIRAADLNDPTTEKTIRKRYQSRVDLDVPFGRILRLRGNKVAVPDPEYLGRYFTNAAGESNLVLYNPKAVIPVL
jgi:hypothetical protein